MARAAGHGAVSVPIHQHQHDLARADRLLDRLDEVLSGFDGVDIHGVYRHDRFGDRWLQSLRHMGPSNGASSNSTSSELPPSIGVKAQRQSVADTHTMSLFPP